MSCGVNDVQAYKMALEARPLYSDGQRRYKDFASGTWMETAEVSHSWCRIEYTT